MLSTLLITNISLYFISKHSYKLYYTYNSACRFFISMSIICKWELIFCVRMMVHIFDTHIGSVRFCFQRYESLPLQVTAYCLCSHDGSHYFIHISVACEFSNDMNHLQVTANYLFLNGDAHYFKYTSVACEYILMIRIITIASNS